MNESRPSETLNVPKVKEWMKRERWNQTSLARRLRIDPGTMSRYLSGKIVPPYVFLVALSTVSGISLEEIVVQRAA